jgi:hypothetical protein
MHVSSSSSSSATVKQSSNPAIQQSRTTISKSEARIIAHVCSIISITDDWIMNSVIAQTLFYSRCMRQMHKLFKRASQKCTSQILWPQKRPRLAKQLPLPFGCHAGACQRRSNKWKTTPPVEELLLHEDNNQFRAVRYAPAALAKSASQCFFGVETEPAFPAMCKTMLSLNSSACERNITAVSRF